MNEHAPTSSSAPILVVTFDGQPPDRSVSPESESGQLRGVHLFRAIGRRLGRPEDTYDREDEEEEEMCSRSSSTDSDDRSCSSNSEGGGRAGRKSRSKKANQAPTYQSSSASSSRSVDKSYSSCGPSHSHSHSHHHHHHTGSSGSDTSSGSAADSGIESPGSSATSSSSSSSSSSSGSSSSSAKHHRSSSILKVFQSLSLNARSHSAPDHKDQEQTGASSTPAASGKRRSKSKKSPKRILRSPVSYTYVRGLSGLPTQRVPRGHPCIYLPASLCCEAPHFTGQHLAGLHR